MHKLRHRTFPLVALLVGIAAALSAVLGVACSSPRYEQDLQFCQSQFDDKDNITVCMRSRGWHDARGLRN